MSWKSLITASYIRSLIGETDASRDTVLQVFLDNLVSELEILTGIDFDFTDSSISKIFTYGQFKNEFVLKGRILQCECWQSISTVEMTRVSTNQTWQTLVLDQDFMVINHSTNPNPIFQIEPIQSKFKKFDRIRITGIYGFGNSTTIPKPILSFLAEMLRAYLIFLENGGKSNINSESDLTSSISYGQASLADIVKLLSPKFVPELNSLIKNYNVKPNYPF